MSYLARKLLGFTLSALIVVGHLETSSSETALDVETFVGLAAVQDTLVAADLLGDVVERLDDSETELLALLVLCDGDILDVADGAKAVNAVEDLVSLAVYDRGNRVDSRAIGNSQLALGNQSTSADDRTLFTRGVLNDDNVVAASSGHVIVLLSEVGLGDIADGGQDA
jgi:hypothetical protein